MNDLTCVKEGCGMPAMLHLVHGRNVDSSSAARRYFGFSYCSAACAVWDLTGIGGDHAERLAER